MTATISSADEERIRAEYISFACFIGLPIRKSEQVSSAVNTPGAIFGLDAMPQRPLFTAPCGVGGSPAPMSASTVQLLSNQQDASKNASILAKLPVALVKLVVDDIRMKLFKTYGEGACEYLLKNGALPPLHANSSTMSRSVSPPATLLACTVGCKRPTRDEDEPSRPNVGQSIAVPHPTSMDGGYRVMPADAHRRLSGGHDDCGSLFSSTALSVSVRADEMLSPNSTIQRMLLKQEAAKGHGGGHPVADDTPVHGGHQPLSLARAYSATPNPSDAVKRLQTSAPLINPKFPQHSFSSKLLSKEELHRVINFPLPEPQVVTDRSGKIPQTRLTLPSNTMANAATSAYFAISEHLHRRPMCETDRLIFLKEQEELLADSIKIAKHRNEELERDVFIYKDKCERMTKVWKSEMQKEESTLKSYEMGILESRRKIDKARMELKRSQLEEERLSKIIKNSKPK